MMRLYNYLFAVTYELELRRGGKEMLWLWPCSHIVINLNFIVVALRFILERLDVMRLPDGNFTSYAICICIAIAVICYYLIGKRYKRIVEQYRPYVEKKRKSTLFIIWISYYTISFLLLLTSGFFYNHDWIFK